MGTPQPNGENTSTTNNSTPNSSSSFSCTQTLYCSIARADLHLIYIKLSKGLQQNTN